MHFSPAFILAALPFLATAKQPLKSRQTSSSYTLLAIHSGDEAVHNQPIVASNEYFYIGKNSSASCPGSDSQTPCNTQTQVSLGDSTVDLAVSVPGGQQVFVTSDGALSYTPPHSHLIPAGAKSSGFQPYADSDSSGSASGDGVSNLGFVGANAPDWLACPDDQDDGAYYQIFAYVTGANGNNTAQCHDIAIALVSADASQAASQFD